MRSFAASSLATATPEMLETLDRDGALLLTDAAPAELMDRLAGELAPWIDLPVEDSPLPHTPFTGKRTLRTSGLLGKSREAGTLAQDPRVLALTDHVLGPQCARFQISFTQAIKIGPGERAQPLHRDSNMYPFKRPGPEVFVNAIWALTDFTPENGATRIILGSHRWDEPRVPQQSDPIESAAMRRGSLFFYLGSCFHGGGANVTADARIGVAFGYTLGWLRQEENQYLAVPQEVARTLSLPLQRLMGYAEHFPFLGWHEGAEMEVLRGDPARKEYQTALQGGQALPVGALSDKQGAVGKEPTAVEPATTPNRV